MKISFPEKKLTTEKQLALITKLVENLEEIGVEVEQRPIEDIGHASATIKLLMAVEKFAGEVQGE